MKNHISEDLFLLQDERGKIVCTDLAGADDELLVDVLRRDAEERRELPAANHVGARVRVSQKPRREHIRYQLLYAVP